MTDFTVTSAIMIVLLYSWVLSAIKRPHYVTQKKLCNGSLPG